MQQSPVYKSVKNEARRGRFELKTVIFRKQSEEGKDESPGIFEKFKKKFRELVPQRYNRKKGFVPSPPRKPKICKRVCKFPWKHIFLHFFLIFSNDSKLIYVLRK